MKLYGEDYVGARFLKCDLQMHTPADPHWVGENPLPSNPTEDNYREAADKYIRRCYELGLEVIAITDHNFASKRFIPYLRDAIDNQVGEFSYKIVLFPGFEIQADVGRGCHVMAIFNPDEDLETIDHTLTECGVPPPRFRNGSAERSTRRLPDILKLVQRKNRETYVGIVICPHAQSDAGIFDTDRIAEWLQQEEFTNPALLCIEVPKIPEEMSDGWQKLLRSGEDCDPPWRRIRPIACIMSSDAKALSPEEGAENYIGFRHTWIKMSEPSVEALRQAFLDHDSRIRFGEKRPEEAYSYPKIRRIQVQGATFLVDQDISFSPNINTIIGGRGTGKSTIIEYLRFVLDQEQMIHGEDPRKNLERLKGTIRANTTILAEIEKEEKTWIIGYTKEKGPHVIEGQDIPDIKRFFPARILSQKEIYAIAEDREARRELVDNLIREQLDEKRRLAEDLIKEIRRLNEIIIEEPKLQERRRELETECLSIKARLERLRDLEEPLRRWKGLLAEKKFLEKLEEEHREIALSLRDAVKMTTFSCAEIGDELTTSPNAGLIAKLSGKANSLVASLGQTITGAVESFERGIIELLDGDEVKTWREEFDIAQQEYNRDQEELAAKGTDPDQYLEYERQLKEREAQMAVIETDLSEHATLRAERDSRLGQLEDLWQEETSLRENKSKELMAEVPKTKDGEPFVRVQVDPFADDYAFANTMQKLVQDRRRITLDEWGYFDEIRRKIIPDDSFLARLITARKENESPIQAFLGWIETLRSGMRPEGCPWGPQDRRTSVLLEWCTETRLVELRLWRPPDRVRVELYRLDGSRVGELEEGLSIGQRCTAVLALLLAQDDEPAIIDQPEEDLDNEFIYTELVPLLRRIRDKRQLIIVTNNSNIPVNADADLILALEVREERGHIKEINGHQCIGALDCTAVRLAVESIMEGSEDAFRRRSEKYGF